MWFSWLSWRHFERHFVYWDRATHYKNNPSRGGLETAFHIYNQMQSYMLVLIKHVSLPKSPSSAMVFRHKTPTWNQGCKTGKINETHISTKRFCEGVILKTLLFLVAGIIYVINYFLLKLHNYIAFKFCGDKYRLTEEEKKNYSAQCTFFFPRLSRFLMAVYELSIVSQIKVQQNVTMCQFMHHLPV